jgi:hypothetical protein
MPIGYFLPSRQTLSGLAAIMLVALAASQFRVSTSVPKLNFDSDEPGSKAETYSAIYPVRFDLGKNKSRNAVTYPVLVALRSQPVDRTGAKQGRAELFLAMALQVPEMQFGITTSDGVLRDGQPAENQAGRDEADLDSAPAIDRDKQSKAEQSGISLARFINVKYDLTSQSSSAEHLAIRKPLYYNGAASGEVTLRVAQDSRISARLADLQRVLGEGFPASIRKAASEEGFVDFNALRAAGFAVRYDAGKDVIQLTTTPKAN